MKNFTRLGASAIFAALTVAGCCAVDVGDCSPEAIAVTDPTVVCSDRWVCKNGVLPDDVYEVRCTTDGDAGSVCRCLWNGVEGRTVGSSPWCGSGSGDAFERISDANRQCGWAMSTCHI